MRILSKRDASDIDVEFIYKRGYAIAIIQADFLERFNIVKK